MSFASPSARSVSASVPAVANWTTDFTAHDAVVREPHRECEQSRRLNASVGFFEAPRATSLPKPQSLASNGADIATLSACTVSWRKSMELRVIAARARIRINGCRWVAFGHRCLQSQIEMMARGESSAMLDVRTAQCHLDQGRDERPLAARCGVQYRETARGPHVNALDGERPAPT